MARDTLIGLEDDQSKVQRHDASFPILIRDLRSDLRVMPAAQDSMSDRVLKARLNFSYVKRRGVKFDATSDGQAGLSWFEYQVGGFGIGIVEGVLLGEGTDIDQGWLERAVKNSRASLIKLTRAMQVDAEITSSRQIEPNWIVVRHRSPARDILPLATTDEATLARLGRHTRRNLRAARKQAASSGFTFEASSHKPLISDAERAELAGKTQPFALRSTELSRLEAYVDSTGRPFRSLVRDADGAIVSYCCGYFGAPDAAYLMYQLNDSAHHAIGPALLHRALLLPWLIERRCAELVFVHGCIGVLNHSCVPQLLEEVWLMRRSTWAYSCAALIRWVKPGAPIGRLARLALDGSEPAHSRAT